MITNDERQTDSKNWENLKKEFASNTRFRYAVDEFFTSTKKLTEYDSNLHCYKLKYLFAQSLK